MNRRMFLAMAAGALVHTRAGRAFQSGSAAGRRLLQLNGYALDAETPLDQLTTYLTPNDLFFVRHHWNPTEVDEAAWALEVDGEVERPLRLSLDELRGMPQTTATCVLQCAGNGRALFDPPIAGVQWRYGAVGNARWTGVRVRDLLDRAGLRAGVRHLHTFGSDVPPEKVPPFHRSIEIEKVLADGLVAIGMNDEPLPFHHGAPARLVVPGWAGDHWMKWLRTLTASAEPQTGFYMETAYRYPVKPGPPGVAFKPAEMGYVTDLFVKSSITTAPRAARIGTPVTIRGFAFSGAPDVSKVELSDDDGQSWQLAALDPQHDPYAWRLWSFAWTPRRPGRSTLVARATDSGGAVQPREGVWNQSGYLHNGWHAVTIEVTA